MDFDKFVIEMPEETAKVEGTESSVLDTKLTELELKMARFMDSEFSILGWKPGITWGDVISGANDGAYAQYDNLGFSYSELNKDIKE
jgi:hypothetical protein